MTNHKMNSILIRAQETYGYANQVSVATEELCELGSVLSKYVRYPNHETASMELRSKILDEIADVNVVLNHLYLMFGIDKEELERAMEVKLIRLERWLNKSSDFYHTTQDRRVDKV